MNSQDNIYDLLSVYITPTSLNVYYLFSNANYKILIPEENKKYLREISATKKCKSFKFDEGKHFFFFKNKEIKKLLNKILYKNFLINDRKLRTNINLVTREKVLDFINRIIKITLRLQQT